MLKNPIKSKAVKRVERPFFIVYTVDCYISKEEPILMEISPFSLLLAASIIGENSKTDIETSYSTAMLNVIASLEEYHILTAVNQR